MSWNFQLKLVYYTKKIKKQKNILLFYFTMQVLFVYMYIKNEIEANGHEIYSFEDHK